MCDYFLIPSVGTCLGTQKNRLIEGILLSIKKECLIWETWKKNNLSMHNYFEVKHYAY